MRLFQAVVKFKDDTPFYYSTKLFRDWIDAYRHGKHLAQQMGEEDATIDFKTVFFNKYD